MTRSTARSVCGSSPTRSATRSRPSGSVTPIRVAPGDDVTVGEDQAVGREDESRAGAAGVDLHDGRTDCVDGRHHRASNRRPAVRFDPGPASQISMTPRRSPRCTASVRVDDAELAEDRRQVELHRVLADRRARARCRDWATRRPPAPARRARARSAIRSAALSSGLAPPSPPRHRGRKWEASTRPLPPARCDRRVQDSNRPPAASQARRAASRRAAAEEHCD